MQRITIHTANAIHLIKVRDIIYCKSNNSYTTFYITNHTPITVSQSIKTVEKQLSEAAFIRPHQSFLVNPLHVEKVSKINNYTILLSDKSIIPIATRKRKKTLQILLKI